MCTALDYIQPPVESTFSQREAGVAYAHDVGQLIRVLLAMSEVFKDPQYKAITDPLVRNVAPRLVGILTRSVAQLPDVARVRKDHVEFQAKMLKLAAHEENVASRQSNAKKPAKVATKAVKKANVRKGKR